jgi:hypothetical protein
MPGEHRPYKCKGNPAISMPNRHKCGNLFLHEKTQGRAAYGSSESSTGSTLVRDGSGGVFANQFPGGREVSYPRPRPTAPLLRDGPQDSFVRSLATIRWAEAMPRFLPVALNAPTAGESDKSRAAFWARTDAPNTAQRPTTSQEHSHDHYRSPPQQLAIATDPLAA